MTLPDIIRLAGREGANIADGEVLVRLADGRKIKLRDVCIDVENNVVLLELREEK